VSSKEHRHRVRIPNPLAAFEFEQDQVAVHAVPIWADCHRKLTDIAPQLIGVDGRSDPKTADVKNDR
jgi:hypothetical protein